MIILDVLEMLLRIISLQSTLQTINHATSGLC